MTDASTTEAPATNVIEALRRVMRDLPGIGKDQRMQGRDGSQGYAYRGIEQITKEAQGLCARHGVVFVPRVVGVPEVVEIEVNKRPWTDTRMLVEYDVYSAAGPAQCDTTRITVGPIFAIGRDNSDKGANKCMSQAFKYALLQTLMIADAKDDGDAAVHEADSYSRAESGEPYRRATLRADVRVEDVTRMRMAELAERLNAAGLPNSGTLKQLRDRLAEHVGATPVPEPAAPALLLVGDEAMPVRGPECEACGEVIPDEGTGDELGVEDDEGRLFHARCAS